MMLNQNSRHSKRSDKVVSARCGHGGRFILTMLLLIISAADSALADTIRLRRSVVLPSDAETLPLRVVAELTGPAALAVGETTIRSAAELRGEDGSVVTLNDVREALAARGVNLGQIAFSGARCRVYLGTRQHAEPPARRAKESTTTAGMRRLETDQPGVWASELLAEGTLRGQVAQLLAGTVYQRAPATVRLEFLNNDRNKLKLSTAAHDFELIPQATASSPRVPVQVRVFQGDRFIRTFRLVVLVKLQQEVFVAERYLARGGVIRPGDFSIQTRLLEPNTVAALPTTEELTGKEARGRIVKGAVLRIGDILLPVSVKRNDEVMLMIKRGDFTLSMQGRALESGRIGEVIRVRSLTKKNEMLARIEDGGILTIISK